MPGVSSPGSASRGLRCDSVCRSTRLERLSSVSAPSVMSPSASVGSFPVTRARRVCWEGPESMRMPVCAKGSCVIGMDEGVAGMPAVLLTLSDALEPCVKVVISEKAEGEMGSCDAG